MRVKYKSIGLFEIKRKAFRALGFMVFAMGGPIISCGFDLYLRKYELFILIRVLCFSFSLVFEIRKHNGPSTKANRSTVLTGI